MGHEVKPTLLSGSAVCSGDQTSASSEQHPRSCALKVDSAADEEELLYVLLQTGPLNEHSELPGCSHQSAQVVASL